MLGAAAAPLRYLANAILHGPASVEELAFGYKFALQAFLLSNPVDANQRSLANGLQGRGHDLARAAVNKG